MNLSFVKSQTVTLLLVAKHLKFLVGKPFHLPKLLSYDLLLLQDQLLVELALRGLLFLRFDIEFELFPEVSCALLHRTLHKLNHQWVKKDFVCRGSLSMVLGK